MYNQHRLSAWYLTRSRLNNCRYNTLTNIKHKINASACLINDAASWQQEVLPARNVPHHAGCKWTSTKRDDADPEQMKCI
jgi:hypothetical protein